MLPTKENLERIKVFATALAKHCGTIQMEYFRKENIGIHTKTNVYDVVTKVDKLCEAYLLKEISASYPDHSVIAEETGKHMNQDSDWIWYIDPLDGTTSYSQGLPVFSVSIGVTYKGEGVVGVVCAPYLNELFHAVKDGGAYLSYINSAVKDDNRPDIRLHVSKKTELSQCVLASGFPYDKATHPKNNIREAGILIPQIRGFRRMGSAAYDLCSTAMGTIDAYWEYNLNTYDCSAGELIVKEAGGIVVPLCSDRKISIIAGPEILANKIHELISRTDITK